MDRNELAAYLDVLLECGRFRDYCPNGLQVEGRPEIRRIVCAVSASLALLEAAREDGADAVLVHHGWFWRGEDGRVIGIRRARLKTLLENDLSLFAYHLPLDAHAQLGNNAQLARLMGWDVQGRFGEQDLGWVGSCEDADAAALGRRLGAVLGRDSLVVGAATARPLCRLAWCTGAAQGAFEDAIAAGADCYVSGEISEQTVHLARESGVAYIAAGHHATERYGVRALGEHLAARFGLRCEFVDDDNPV